MTASCLLAWLMRRKDLCMIMIMRRVGPNPVMSVRLGASLAGLQPVDDSSRLALFVGTLPRTHACNSSHGQNLSRAHGYLRTTANLQANTVQRAPHHLKRWSPEVACSGARPSCAGRGLSNARNAQVMLQQHLTHKGFVLISE